MAAAAAAGGGAGWTALGTPTAELRLEFTLPTGQSFRWVKTGGDEYTGVIGQRVVRQARDGRRQPPRCFVGWSLTRPGMPRGRRSVLPLPPARAAPPNP